MHGELQLSNNAIAELDAVVSRPLPLLAEPGGTARRKSRSLSGEAPVAT